MKLFTLGKFGHLRSSKFGKVVSYHMPRSLAGVGAYRGLGQGLSRCGWGGTGRG